MRGIVTLSLVVGLFAPEAAAQSGPAAGAGKTVIRACSLLTKELVLQVTPQSKEVRDLTLQVPPMEDLIGRSGSACSYGGIILQVDPFAVPAEVEKDLAKEWTRVTGVGDIAFFRDNSGEYAELYVRSGGRVLTIQMDVPNESTAAAIQSNTIALAKALLPKLK